jgi:O-antigen ligase
MKNEKILVGSLKDLRCHAPSRKMKFLVFIKAFILLLPLGWFILQGPGALKVFLIGGAFALIELARTASLRSMRSAWPIPCLVGLYLVAGWIAPEIDAMAETYGVSGAVATVCYGVPAGFCIALWSRKEPGGVLLAFVLFGLGLAVAANGLIRAVGAESLLIESASEVVRGNPDADFVFLGIFKASNVVIGIIPMTAFAIGALPLLLLPGWTLQKILLILASIAGVYGNILVATRTTLLAATLSFTCVFTLLYYKGAIKRARMILMLLVCIASGVLLVIGLELGNRLDPLMERFSQLGSDARFDIWKESATLLWNNPLGIGKYNLPSAIWAHNLFLDFGLTNGWLGMASMLALHGFIFYSIWRAVQKTDILAQPVGVVFLSVVLATFFISFTEPPQGDLLAFSYLMCGYCLGSEYPVAKRSLGRRMEISDLPDRRPEQA